MILTSKEHFRSIFVYAGNGSIVLCQTITILFCEKLNFRFIQRLRNIKKQLNAWKVLKPENSSVLWRFYF